MGFVHNYYLCWNNTSTPPTLANISVLAHSVELYCTCPHWFPFESQSVLNFEHFWSTFKKMRFHTYSVSLRDNPVYGIVRPAWRAALAAGHALATPTETGCLSRAFARGDRSRFYHFVLFFNIKFKVKQSSRTPKFKEGAILPDREESMAVWSPNNHRKSQPSFLIV